MEARIAWATITGDSGALAAALADVEASQNRVRAQYNRLGQRGNSGSTVGR